MINAQGIDFDLNWSLLGYDAYVDYICGTLVVSDNFKRFCSCVFTF